MKVEEKIKKLGITLYPPPKPVAEYLPAKQFGNLIYISGQDCRENGQLIFEGKVGKDITIKEGEQAARQAAINAISVLKMQVGNLDNIKQIVKILGFVNSAEGFIEQPAVINGASSLLVEVFGECGKHSRSAISSNELPFNTPVELELIAELK